jgi:hypothetical protein
MGYGFEKNPMAIVVLKGFEILEFKKNAESPFLIP